MSEGNGKDNGKGKRKVTVLHDNPVLPAGKQFFLASMISPDSRQKHSVHGFKFHDMCESEEEGRDLAKYYHDLDPDFDVFLGKVGKWCPWIWDTDDLSQIDVEYANAELTNLIKSHRMQRQSMDKQWKSEYEKNIEEIRKGNTREGQLELANKKEAAVSVWFKIKQVEAEIKQRKEDLENLKTIYHTEYKKSERLEAQKANLPLSEPRPMQYALLGSNVVDEDVNDQKRLHAIKENIVPAIASSSGSGSESIQEEEVENPV
jgi:hypothetical protein